MPIKPAPNHQLALWPAAEQTCPKCRGTGDVYYLHAHRPNVAVASGKRVICPVCAGGDTINVPAQPT